MRKLNAHINVFVGLQILFGVGWIFVTNNIADAFDSFWPMVRMGYEALGLSDISLGLAMFATFVIGVLGSLLGIVIWLYNGEYRRGIGMIVLVMGVGVLFGAAARLMRPLNEMDSIGYLLIGRSVLVLVIYLGLAAMVASQVLEWIAADALRNSTVRIRHSRSVPLCTILPVAHLWIGYAETVTAQFVALGIGSLVLIAFTILVNRENERELRRLSANDPDAPHVKAGVQIQDRRSEFPQFRV